MTRQTARKLTLFCILSLIIVGCGPSASDVVEEYRDDYTAFTASIDAMLEKIPAGPAGEQPLQGVLQPAMEIKPNGEGNTECIALEKLRDPSADIDIDLYLDMELSPALSWMQPGNAPSNGDPEFMRKTLQTAFHSKYLVVYRTSNYVAAKVIDKSEFLPATIDFELFLFDISQQELIGVTKFTAQTPDSVTVFVRGDQDEEERMSASIKSALYEDALKKLATTLEQFAGATVVYD